MAQIIEHPSSENEVTSMNPITKEIPKDQSVSVSYWVDYHPLLVNGKHGKAISTPAEDILERPLGALDHVRVIIVGAGASGLNMIRTMRKHLANFDLVVYEKNPEVGGTCWHLNPKWSAFFAGAPEIEQYLLSLTEADQLRTSVKLSHQIVHAEWNEDDAQWLLRVKNLQTGDVFDDHCNFLLNAGGILNNWTWPKIEGIHSYQGQLIHSADWPNQYDFSGKTVAVIGNGSSGVQIVPAIQPEVGKLVHFIRSPTWIAPSHLERMALTPKGSVLSNLGITGEEFSKELIDRFVEDPAYYLEFVKQVEVYTNNKFKATVNGTPEAEMAVNLLTSHMKDRLENDRRLIDFLVPDFPVGCRRITPGVGYLESLHKPNVQVVTDAIAEITPKGLLTSAGEHFDVDVIVCATGFDVSFCPRFPVIGRNGINLQDLWTEQLPSAYMSCMVPQMPNYFMFLGPNAPIGHGSVLTITEHIAKYLVKLIQKCQTQCIKTISPKQEAVDDFLEHIQKFMPRTAWSANCRSWFKNGKATGPVTALHPGSRIHWFHMLEESRGEDFDYVKSTKNRFAYLGNGFSTREMPGADQTWYLDHPDDLF